MMKKGCMFNKKNKVSETMICRYIYITLTLIVVSNVIAFPCLSLFPFQWALILGALFINTFHRYGPYQRNHSIYAQNHI